MVGILAGPPTIAAVLKLSSLTLLQHLSPTICTSPLNNASCHECPTMIAADSSNDLIAAL